MNIAHLHLALNHFPVVGSIIVALLFALALRRRSDELGRAALLLAALVGAVSIAVYFTGEPAEELIERLPGVSEAVTEQHEEAALVATLVVGALGALSAVVLGMHRGHRALSRRTTGAALALALVACGAMGYTAFLGGQVRHTEIRSGATAARGGGAPVAAESDDDNR
ncbi:MAG TPA: DUF2231 domain-containing protein, partial [Gemmatimonadaceae bacterium]|nr:DUF2231 domain-containing protein [Gemmatimonadaceae bacterium]